ncbi:MAG: CPBP family intramembrane metalloprotease [Ruminococcus flavefaciens]|nr:CPBP family intramembrane metalloprotease [Ruminococcus flavefaciens]
MKVFSALCSEVKLVLLVFLIPVLLIIVLTMALGFSEINAETTYTVAGTAVQIIIAILYLNAKGMNVKEAFKKPDIKFMLLVLVFRFCWLIFSTQFFFSVFSAEDEFHETSLLTDIATFTLVPVAEEIIFRYGMINFGRKSAGIFVAGTLSALIFTVLHFGNTPETLRTFGNAIFYTAIYCLTGNIAYTISAHAMNNLFATTAYPLIENLVSADTPAELINPYFFISILGMGISILFMVRRYKKISQKSFQVYLI